MPKKRPGARLAAAMAAALVACSAGPTRADRAGTTVASPPARSPRPVEWVPRSTRKVCQLTGETDRQTGKPTLNRTESRAGVYGTDLGIPVAHGRAVYFLFGDTAPRLDLLPTLGLTGGSTAVSTDREPADCLRLDFVTDPATGLFLRHTVPGVSLRRGFEVPSGGFSAAGTLYAFFTTDHSDEHVMGRSVLVASRDGARTWSLVYSASTDKFVNVAAVVSTRPVPGLRERATPGVFLFGSGEYRASSPSLAWVPLDRVRDRRAWRFFAGTDPRGGRPRWSRHESEAVPLFDRPCVGELSATWDRTLRHWLLLYNCDAPRGIHLRAATEPWGTWSEPLVVFEPERDGAYCAFMHAVKTPPCDRLSDPLRDTASGAEYGPYVLPRVAAGREDETTLYFTMSTWNPYDVVLMRTTLRLGAE